ncbi:MAG: ParB-like partition protein [Verrucomicrobiales bacterium]|nr:ParB-like partition protein [Verrucomicrobiales bacterium]
MAKPALGRGLGALLGGSSPGAKSLPVPQKPSSQPAAPPDTRERVERIPLARIKPCSFQPRKDFSDESIRELAESIREQGVVQPLIVRAKGEDYELIAGERRWRAAQLLNLTEVPALVRVADDRTVLELALIENLQRENLNAIEEALGYSQLIEQFDLTQEQVSVKVGKSRVTVANALRLLKLPPQIRDYLRTGLISVGHAKVLLSLESAEQQELAALKIIKDALSVRATEALVEHLQNASSSTTTRANGSHSKAVTDVHVADMQNKLIERLGTKVALRCKNGKGAIEIKFFNLDELQRVLDLLGVSSE